jgi:hypothetical protein
MLLFATPVIAQRTTGQISVTVLDQQSAVIPGAGLELKDAATNEIRTAVTQSGGNFTFVNLPPGKYTLTISAEGFQQAVYDAVVSGTKSTDIDAKLKVGGRTETVKVEAPATAVVEETQDTIGAVIDLKEIEGLPLGNRDISGLARIVPGYNGTWNGLPTMAQGTNVDGVIGTSSRMKFNPNYTPAVQVRLENIEEMTVQTDQLDMNQGFGMAAMQSNFVTRRGTNQFHGGFYEDHRNDDLNANSWRNNAVGTRRAESKLNDFGGSIGGPVIKNKLFTFFSLAASRQPGASTRTSTFLTPSAQQGNFTYVGTDGQTRTVNLFSVAQNFNATLPGAVNGAIAGQFQQINTAVQSGIVATTTDPTISSVNWLALNPTNMLFPTLRVDYTPAARWRTHVSINRTKQDNPNLNSPYFPGDAFTKAAGGTKSDNVTAAYGLEWTVSPTLLNSFTAGYLYDATWNSYNSSRAYITNPITLAYPLGLTSPVNYSLPVTTFYPVINISDTLTWQKKTHTFNFGYSFYREQDHYWNPPELTHITTGLVQGDPALDALTNAGSYQPLPFASTAQQANARSIYALLTGRISGVNGSFPYDPKTKNYVQIPARYFPLDEVAKASGLFIQDSWRLRPNLTVNGGLRWDFTAASHDLQAAYHSADLSSLWGPSGIGNIFKPGVLTGNQNPTVAERQPYQNWYVAPQPSLGVAWTPRSENGIVQKLLGSEGTVIRSSFSVKRFTVPYQYFWNNASDYGGFYYQFYSTTARNVSGVGSFAPGSLSLGQPLPPFLVQPAAYEKVASESEFTFNNSQFTNGSNGMKFDIAQPRTMTWTFGIQRHLGRSRALEVRFNGNRTPKQWISLNLNEVNIFENGFLDEFKKAQNNLKINGGNSFANLNPAAGTVPLPILTSAFTGSAAGPQTNSNFTSGTFITQLNTGAAGSMAQTLTTVGASPYFCNLVGASFTPCANNVNYTGAGAGYPINFFQANPYATGIPSLLMTDEGYSNYNALQVDFRQQSWHGLQFDANYTWSHTLGISSPNDWTGAYNAYTLRNLRDSYGPTLYDAHQTVNFSGTADLPFGQGRKWLSGGGALDKVAGGWTVGTITNYRTGYPFRVQGGYSTFNNIADGGVNLNGVTRQQLQDAVGVYKTPGQTFVELINPKFRTAGVGANTGFITANTTPGTIAPVLWLFGPGGFFSDISLTKETPIKERYRFIFQAQFLNAFNHPVFGTGTTPVGVNTRTSSWATATAQTGNPRVIEFRARIAF